MKPCIGVRRETKSPWERRAPVTPDLARHLVRSLDIDVLIQPSARRVFSDADYTRAGATVSTSLAEANIVLGVKEIPPELLQPRTAYLFFAHVIKGQPANMPMLQRLLDLGCTLIDYEKIVDDEGRRLVFFGRFAGLAGMIDTLWALGQRLAGAGIRTPFTDLEPAHAYDSLEAAKTAVRAVGERISVDGLPDELAPLVVGIAGYGNVAKGAREILSELPTREVAATELDVSTLDRSSKRLYQVTFKEQDIVCPRSSGAEFELHEYYDHPERYQANFARHLPHLTVLMNCNYWDERYPRLVTIEDLRRQWHRDDRPPRLQVIGDLGCDVGGAIECTLRCTDPGDPVYVFDVTTGNSVAGVNGDGPAVLAVDILPSELPLEASEEFAKALSPILPALARADFNRPLAEIDLPAEVRRAVIVHQGRLTRPFEGLEVHLPGRAGRSETGG
ncbi:MAG: bifunctional lysine ketoglutarate reductase /saccharopine dehydrogenase family protein [Holophagae bacterium]|jgi:alpha-aminoadipic semialdehyde synthase